MKKLLGLIGYPLTHSFSQQYFSQKFKNEKITGYEYRNFPIANLDDFLVLLQQHPHIVGLNVTIPYKEKILQYADYQDVIVTKIGATNTLLIDLDGKIKAYNTDVTGFFQSFVKHLKPHHQKALILGTGGASKAVAYVLNQLKIPFYKVSRNPSNNQQIAYGDLNKNVMKEHQIIINTTPVGTFPAHHKKPTIPYEFIGSKHFFYDLVYNPEQTLFLKEARKRGADFCNGLEMLKLQAEAAWQIWQKKSS